jgi:uncharacterized membrane protein YkvI
MQILFKNRNWPTFFFFFFFWIFLATTLEDECASEINHEYNMPMRVGALFIIFGTSALGIYNCITNLIYVN